MIIITGKHKWALRHIIEEFDRRIKQMLLNIPIPSSGQPSSEIMNAVDLWIAVWNIPELKDLEIEVKRLRGIQGKKQLRHGIEGLVFMNLKSCCWKQDENGLEEGRKEVEG